MLSAAGGLAGRSSFYAIPFSLAPTLFPTCAILLLDLVLSCLVHSCVRFCLTEVYFVPFPRNTFES